MRSRFTGALAEALNHHGALGFAGPARGHNLLNSNCVFTLRPAPAPEIGIPTTADAPAHGGEMECR